MLVGKDETSGEEQINKFMQLHDTKLREPQALICCPSEVLGCTDSHCRFGGVRFMVLLCDRLGGLCSKRKV